MVITEDADWISVLNDDDVVISPEDLCARVLRGHKLQNTSGILQLIREDDPEVRPSSSLNFGKAEGASDTRNSSAISKVINIQEIEAKNLIADDLPRAEDQDYAQTLTRSLAMPLDRQMKRLCPSLQHCPSRRY